MPLVKICGTTTPADAQLAASAGADFVGVIVEHPPSPRSVSLEMAQEIAVATSLPVVAVTVNLPWERLLGIAEFLRPHALQLHGDESVELMRELKKRGWQVWGVAAGDALAVEKRALALQNAGADAILVDARHVSPTGTIYGGTGQRSDWNLARRLVEAGFRIILAGGLEPGNVAQAVAEVAPWMMDVVSGVEAQKGVKDPEKVRDFVARAKNSSPNSVLA